MGKPPVIRYSRTWASLAAILLVVSAVPVATGQSTTPPKFQLSPASIAAGRTRLVKITTESNADLTDFEVEAPPDYTGVSFVGPAQLVDGDKTIIVSVKVEDDADEQILVLNLTRKVNGKVQSRHTADLEITEFRPQGNRKQGIPPGVEPDYAVDSMIQPMSYSTTKDVFGRRVADAYYAVVVALGNNTGYDLQVNKIGFITPKFLEVPDITKDGMPVMENVKPKMHKEFLQIAAIDRTLVRASVEKDQDFGQRALVANLISGFGTLTTGFLPFFHALGPRANFSSVGSILNGQFKEGFNQAVPDLTIRQLNRLDNNLVMDQDFILPNNSERNTVIFIPRQALGLDNDQLGKDEKQKKKKGAYNDDLQLVRQRLGNLIIVGRRIARYENRQIVVRTGVGSEPAAEEPSEAPTVSEITPNAGVTTALEEVKITGSNFTTGAAVKFGEKLGAIKSITRTEITVIPPSAKGGSTAKVEVINPSGKKSSPKDFTYYSELVVGGSDYSFGPTTGKEIRIIGAGFRNDAKVYIDETELPKEAVTFLDANGLKVKMPAHGAGGVKIKVSNPRPYPNQEPKEMPGVFTYKP